MALLIARSLAVYGASAALFLFLSHRFILPLSRRVALALALAPLLFTGRAVLTGGVYAPVDIVYDAMPFRALRSGLRVPPDRSPPLGDVVYQEIPWRSAVREAVGHGDLPLWNPHVLAGEPLLAVQQPAVLHPGTWIGFLLPLPQAWTFEMTLRLFLALLCAFLFFRDIGCGTVPSILGGLGWAFSNYEVFYLGYPLTPAAAPFPLLLLGLRRIVRSPGRTAFGITVAALWLIVTAGHPETVLHAVAGAGLYFLFVLFGSPRRGRSRALRDALIAGLFALGLSAVLLLPLAEALPHTVEHNWRTRIFAVHPRSVPLGDSAFRLVPQAMPYAVGVSGHGEQKEGFLEPTAYAGSLLFPFAIAGLFSRCRAKWFFLALALLGLAIATRTVLADALARLPLFDIALNERLVFLTGFSLCTLAALGANRLRDGEGAPAFVAGAVASGLGLWWLYGLYRPQMESLAMPASYMRQRFLLQIVPLALAAILVAVLPRRHAARTGLLLLAILLAAQRRLEAGDLYPTMPAETFYPRLSVLSKLPRGQPFRTTALYYSFIPNVAALYDLEDVRGYEAMTFGPLFQTYALWCTHQPVWYNRIDDPGTPFLSFLNVRWVLVPSDSAPPNGWPVLAEGEGVRLAENPRVLARAFAPRFLRAEPDATKRLELMKSIEDFGLYGVLDGPAAGGPAEGWMPNAPARVAVAAYGARSLDLDVDAEAPTLIGTSVTRWPGWRARLDGRPIPTEPYNNAFLSFRVPAGRHRVSLRYQPSAFRAGAAITGVTLAAAVLLLSRRRSAELEENPM